MKIFFAKLKEKRLIKKNFKIALKFNLKQQKNHTIPDFVHGNAYWKCPICLNEHRRIGRNCFTGYEFDKCCLYEAGDRCGTLYASEKGYLFSETIERIYNYKMRTK